VIQPGEPDYDEARPMLVPSNESQPELEPSAAKFILEATHSQQQTDPFTCCEWVNITYFIEAVTPVSLPPYLATAI
jgi:hypothetical protein